MPSTSVCGRYVAELESRCGICSRWRLNVDGAEPNDTETDMENGVKEVMKLGDDKLIPGGRSSGRMEKTKMRKKVRKEKRARKQKRARK